MERFVFRFVCLISLAMKNIFVASGNVVNLLDLLQSSWMGFPFVVSINWYSVLLQYDVFLMVRKVDG